MSKLKTREQTAKFQLVIFLIGILAMWMLSVIKLLNSQFESSMITLSSLLPSASVNYIK